MSNVLLKCELSVNKDAKEFRRIDVDQGPAIKQEAGCRFAINLLGVASVESAGSLLDADSNLPFGGSTSEVIEHRLQNRATPLVRPISGGDGKVVSIRRMDDVGWPVSGDFVHVYEPQGRGQDTALAQYLLHYPAARGFV